MPAAVETAVFANTPAWHGLGEVLDTGGDLGIDVDTALDRSGIDWDVVKTPNFGLKLSKKVRSRDDFLEKVKSGATLKYSDLVWVEDRHTVQKQTDSKALGVVGNTWEPVQNREGFQIITDLLEQAGGVGTKVWIEAAGALENDRRVWILAHCDTGLQIAGEKYYSYLLFWNGHNGRSAVGCALLDLRVVCANTLDWGLQDAKKTGRIVRVRHTTNANERIKEAHHILGLRNQRAEELAQQGEWLVEQSWDEGAFEDFLQTLMVLPEDDGPSHTMISQRQDQVRGIYNGPTCEPIHGTAWGALHAVAEYSDHGRNFTNTETQLKAQWGLTNQTLKQQAFELALDLSNWHQLKAAQN